MGENVAMETVTSTLITNGKDTKVEFTKNSATNHEDDDAKVTSTTEADDVSIINLIKFCVYCMQPFVILEIKISL